VVSQAQRSLALIDAFVAACLAPLAVYILISGLDDLFVALACAFGWMRQRLWGRGGVRRPDARELQTLPQKRIAIFVPAWKEDAVIGAMVIHNIAAIRYRRYDFFVGAYPNDDPTLDAVRELEARFENVHLAVCPHDGPTSKADCLNWTYQRMMLYEEQHGVRFDLVMTHDAEDLVHADSLLWINFYAEEYDFVQIPVLALPTPLTGVVHGVYCDEFAEYQIKDVPAREILGGFLPSNGVGTAYSRAGLEKLAQAESNRIFEPACLTEDYENGMRLHRLGCKQVFVPLTRANGEFIATREYFPQNLHAAIRQRTRWVIGIALQSWERHGWSGGWRQAYWLWRDRKGLLGNPLSTVTNAIFIYGLATWVFSRAAHVPWGLARASAHPVARWMLIATLALQAVHAVVRVGCVWRIYGPLFALCAPLRTLAGNYINTMATFRALWLYGKARLRGEPLVWLKTEHSYPSRETLLGHRRSLGEVLIGSGYVTEEDFASALLSRPAGIRIGEHLVRTGKLTEEDFCEALSLQQGIPLGYVRPDEVNRRVARALPRHIVRSWRVLPFRIAEGAIFLAVPEPPDEEAEAAIRPFTRLEVRFQLVTFSNFEELATQLL